MQTGLHLSIHAFEPTAWDALNPSGYPGLLHGFLSALEDSKSVGEGTGWRPLYASVTEKNELFGAMVCYFKSDSYGEYVFDWAWADAYHRHGLNYYPKCITAIPFTPASGPRILIKHGIDQKEVTRLLLETLKKELTGKVSSWHILFPDEESYQSLQMSGLWLERLGVQFHWFNQGFESFDDHLATFNSKRRKEARRERRRIAEQGITFERLSGSEIDSDALDTLFQCYQMTYRIRGSLGYLTREFFEYAVERIPDAIRVAFAIYQGKRIAMSFCLRDQKTLYGRYWGALYDVDCLHFETCFHQWIEDAIEQGIERFDPGAQGEHKIARGFRPVKTRSLHWIENQEFGSAIEQFLIKERAHIEHYFQACDDHTPFKLSDEALRI
jgi:predicted N-acyltransferase